MPHYGELDNAGRKQAANEALGTNNVPQSPEPEEEGMSGDEIVQALASLESEVPPEKLEIFKQALALFSQVFSTTPASEPGEESLEEV